jgi:hypothetical protein
MNEAQIRQQVHEAIGDSAPPVDFISRLEHHLGEAGQQAAPRFVGIVATFLTLLIVGTLVFTHFKASTPQKPANGLHTYSVNAVVEILSDGSTDICGVMISAVYPRQKCDGTIPLRVDAASLPHDSTLRDGTILTPILELTGTWTGDTLVVTSPPKVASAWSPWEMPGLDSGNAPNDPTAAFLQNQQRLTMDDAKLRAKGIRVLGSGWSKAGFFVILVAGDQTELDYIKRTYGADVVSSWFRLVS